MTNLEWIKSDDERLECILLSRWGVSKYTGEPARCKDIRCPNCIFDRAARGCHNLREEWIKKEHEPLYETGDVVISKKGEIYLVFKVTDGNPIKHLLVAKDVKSFDLGIGSYINKDEIERKIGNIYRDTASDLAYEIVGNYIMIMKEV